MLFSTINFVLGLLDPNVCPRRQALFNVLLRHDPEMPNKK